MADGVREDRIQVLRALSSTWLAQNPTLSQGEHGYEKDTGKFKIGNGNSRWADLDYFLPESAIRTAIQEAISNLPASEGGGVSIQTFTAHVNAAEPHPAYDDGPSLVLLYENAKV